MTPAAIVGLVTLASSLKQSSITYYGQKTHEKKIQTLADKARGLDFTERQFVDVINGIIGLDAWKPAQRLAEALIASSRRTRSFPF